MNSSKLSDKSFEELDILRLSIENNPKNRMAKGSFYLHTPQARKKLNDISWAITYKIDRGDVYNTIREMRH